MLDRRSFILLFCGLLGVLSYYYLRPHIDIFSGGAISESRDEVENKINIVARELGFEAESLSVMTLREQHVNYLKFLRDSLDEKLTIKQMNERGIHLQTWKTILGGKLNTFNVVANSEQLFQEAGNLQIHYSNEGRLIRLFSHSINANPTFVRGQGDSLQTIAQHIVGNIFGYNLQEYEISSDSFSNPATDEGRSTSGELSDVNIQSLEIRWNQKDGVTSGPAELILKLEPVVKEFDDESGFRVEAGFSVKEFVAKDSYEPVALNENLLPNDSSSTMLFNYLFFLCVLILAVFVFSVGLRSIFKGKVEWRRALLIFAVIAAGLYLWRAVFYLNTYNSFLDSNGFIGTTVNIIIFALVVGLYAAMAYISWEALARDQQQKQVNLIDSLWQRKIFVSETGAGIVHGVAVGGIVIGVLSVLTYLTDDFFLQNDSQFGFAEASNSPKLLTININVLTTALLVSIGQIGFIYSACHQWVKRQWLSGILSVVIITLLITVLGRTISTSSSVYEDLLYYFGLAVVFVYAMKEFGLLTIFTAWWFYAVFYFIQPYINSPSTEIAFVGWIQALLMIGPLIYGFIAYRYGVPVADVGLYIPEYEERLKQHLRVEKEIEIARESQYKLMPLQPPKAEGIDVYGFFLPSFEVGGDYFDYVLSYDDKGTPSALTMAVVDVSGKSMRAAMPAVFTSGLLLSRMKYDMPAEILSQVSEPIYSRTDKRTFITCLLARYDLTTKKLSVANAGHCRPVLKRNGIAEFIQTPDPRYPLGLKTNVNYVAHEITLKKGDMLLLYSDGLPEAANEKGERLGFEEVPRLVEKMDTENLTAQEISQEIKRTVQKFSNYQLADDTTIVCLKV